MPLRVRLTFLYTSIVGGILLLFGVAVYASVSLSLISQVDSLLKRTADEIWPNIAVDVSGNLALKRPIDMELSPGLSFQIWNRDRQLIYPLNAPLRRPFDPAGLQSSQPVFRNVFVETNVGNYHMRAYTVPLVIGEGDRFGVTLADGIVHLEPIRKSYFGVFRDLWPDTWMEDLRAERDAWARREEAWTPHEPS